MVNISQILRVCLGGIQLHFKNDEMKANDHISKNTINI